MRKKTTLLMMAGLLGSVLFARAQDATRFPFVIPWDDASHTAVDVSALNPTPAGGNGYVLAKNGHFYDEKGNRVRFIGTNIAFNANFPDKVTAAKVAARLHKYGFNIVRLHHMDFYHAPQGIFDPAFPDVQHLDKDQLDRLDYFVSQLKANGIYVNINLHVSRAFTAADGFPDTDKLPTFDKAVDFFEPKMIALQKNYARDLLTHYNPYTRTRYADETSVAVVEINNENTLLGTAWDNTLDTLPPLYKNELAGLWNAWLKKKYGSQEMLAKAWASEDKPFGPNLLQNFDFTHGAEHWTLENNTPPAASKLELPEEVQPPDGVSGKVLRVRVTTLGTQNWHIQLHEIGLNLTDGEPYTVTFWAKANTDRSLPIYAGLDKADWHNVGLNAKAELTEDWKKFTFAFTANRTEANHTRLTFVLGDALGTIDFADVMLRPGVETTLPEGANLNAGNLPLGHPVANPSGEDWIAFLMDTEQSYVTGLRDYLKKDLKVHANVIGSQASYGGLGGALREAGSDFVDMHAYWQHPEFPHKPWDSVDWRIPNTPLVAAADGGSLTELAKYRLAGKPFTVSEYNNAAPNDFQAESVPLLAAFAAMQDWDGFYLFDYNGDRDAYNSDKIKGYFDVDTNPAKMAFLPAAAYIFLRRDVPAANQELRLRVPDGNVAQLLSRNGPDIEREWETGGVARQNGLRRRLSIAFDKGRKTGPPIRRISAADLEDTLHLLNPIEWKVEGANKAVFTADALNSKVIVGLVGNQTVALPSWQAQVGTTFRDFAALTLTTLDGKSSETSHSLLLTAVGRVENTGMQWNADRTSVGDHWGTGPTLADGISATLKINTTTHHATVYALDGTGKRKSKIPAQIVNGLLTFAIGPDSKTLWYEIEAR